MDEELENDRPLSEEERRQNLARMIGEDKADELFEGDYSRDYSSSSSSRDYSSSKTTKPSGGVNWKIVGIFLGIFIVVLVIGGAITAGSTQVDDIGTPTSTIP